MMEHNRLAGARLLKSLERVEEGVIMQALRLVFVVVLVFFSYKEVKIDTNASSSDGAGARSQQPFPKCTIFFLKDKYVTTEGDPFVVAVEADCPPGAPNDVMIEF